WARPCISGPGFRISAFRNSCIRRKRQWRPSMSTIISGKAASIAATSLGMALRSTKTSPGNTPTVRNNCRSLVWKTAQCGIGDMSKCPDRRAVMGGLAAGAVMSGEAGAAVRAPYRVGVVGAGWFGKLNANALMQVAPVEITALCDVDSAMLQEAQALTLARPD